MQVVFAGDVETEYIEIKETDLGSTLEYLAMD
jgi:hypothetical protein